MNGRKALPGSTTVLYSSVLDSVGVAITSGHYSPGDVLTLEQLQQKFGVSRTIAREVMRILESMSLVRSRRRVGLVVLGPDEWNVFDARVIRWRLDGPFRDIQLRSLTELRVAIEPFAASAAAQFATDFDRATIMELAADMRRFGELGQLEEFLRVDIEFHSLILRASQNEMFAALTDVVAEVLAGRTHHGLMPAAPVEAALAAHQQVASAVFRGEPEAAEESMYRAIAEVRDALRRRVALEPVSQSRVALGRPTRSPGGGARDGRPPASGGADVPGRPESPG